MTDHDLLVRIDERQQELLRDFNNHLSHHWKITILCLGTALSAIASLLVGLLT